ncbi:MAG: hypothetical protein KTR13_10145 [Saprospiraceae bacterium]|nr:hypothetical protein [Saprospiraceae bacterium]
MNRLLFFFLIGFSALVFSNCSDDGGTDIDSSSTPFFPLETGHWVEYKLDSVIYDDFDNSVTNTERYLRIEVGEQVNDGVGGTLTELFLFEKVNPTDNYSLEKVWFAKVDNGVLETVEDNLRFIKLDLPPTTGKSWEGNQFIFPDNGDNPNNSTDFYEGWDYFYEEVGSPFEINGLSFNNTVLVNEVDEFGIVTTHRIGYTRYAENVGVVRKHWEMVIENCGTPGCSEKELPVIDRSIGRKGFFVDWYLIDYKRD